MLFQHRGPTALSSSRVERLLTRPHAPREIRASVLYYASAPDVVDLGRLLHTAPAPEPPTEWHRVCVGARPGTTSPWSSKATDIAQVCGLPVDRLVRLIEYASPEDLHPGFIKTLFDPMTEAVITDPEQLFLLGAPRPVRTVDASVDALRAVNTEWGLALSEDELHYLAEVFTALGRAPTDAELMMFGAANSEHCRHKIFNSTTTLDGVLQDRSLFQMIRNTHALHPGPVISAYHDNAAVMRSTTTARFAVNPTNRRYEAVDTALGLLMKVETHNHPTAISPRPGAATGSGGEIRDEGATGRGGRPKGGMVGFFTSHLRIPGLPAPWEGPEARPDRIASPLQIMLEGPIGGATYNNEFGRPLLTGVFRTLEQAATTPSGPTVRGYHKPIMLAGGMGSIAVSHVDKLPVSVGAALVVLGGPAMLIGLGGGAASSVATGTSSSELDFASVQRANPELERRCQEVIDRCWALGDANPIASIHDVGAGGLSNAFPELVNDAGRGATFDLRAIPSADPSLSPMEIWSNEAQERYVIAIRDGMLDSFLALCERERCPAAVVGRATAEPHLRLTDESQTPVDVPLRVIFGDPPPLQRTASYAPPPRAAVKEISLAETAQRLLHLPCVASKRFLVTIADRSITGLVARDPMVGPYQVPVADVGVTFAGFDTFAGEAMAIGERTPVALLHAEAAARMAVGEALTNLLAADVSLDQIALSANWMCSASTPGEGALLNHAVRAVGMELCPALGLPIPVGKDSMSMRTKWADGEVIAPLSLIVTAFGNVGDARATLTPQLQICEPSVLLLLDLGAGQNRLGASAANQVAGGLGRTPPDLDDPARFKRFFIALGEIRDRLLAYHDRSDGGLFVTVLEMCFAARCGADIAVDGFASEAGNGVRGALFSEELGAVVQVRANDAEDVHAALAAAGVHAHTLGSPRADGQIRFTHGGHTYLQGTRAAWQHAWEETSAAMAILRDHPACAAEEHTDALAEHAGLPARCTFTVQSKGFSDRPPIAILREQGVNGHVEMAAAFNRAGFDTLDVHMSDLLAGRTQLSDVVGLVAAGGFSFGDVLGAGTGWARCIELHPELRAQFEEFFHRDETFTLGVCNGCQMLAQLRNLIPGAAHWPRFERNRSEQFEGRLCSVEVVDSPSILLAGMAGSVLPIAVAHGEGRAVFQSADIEVQGVSMRYVGPDGKATERYPFNPNGSPAGITALTSNDGRATIMMPHPERVFRTASLSWSPVTWTREESPWMQVFHNARAFVG